MQYVLRNIWAYISTGESLDCSQLSIPVDGDVYVAVDEEAESEISVGLECFDYAG